MLDAPREFVAVAFERNLPKRPSSRAISSVSASSLEDSKARRSAQSAFSQHEQPGKVAAAAAAAVSISASEPSSSAMVMDTTPSADESSLRVEAAPAQNRPQVAPLRNKLLSRIMGPGKGSDAVSSPRISLRNINF